MIRPPLPSRSTQLPLKRRECCFDIPLFRGSWKGQILVLALLLALVGCGEQTMGDHVIAQNNEFCVTGDSVSEGEVTVSAVSPLELMGVPTVEQAQHLLQRIAGTDTIPYHLTAGSAANLTTHDRYPLYQSQQMLVDALYNLSVGDIVANYSQTGGFYVHQDHNTLYGAIYLSLALLDPQRAMTTLRNQVEDQLVMQYEGTWPVCDDRMAWPVAAWEVYCTTGDKHWLEEAYDITLNTIDEQLAVQFDNADGLMHGGQLARYAAGNFYPDWTDAITVTQIETLINNVLAVRAMEVAGEMAEELGETPPYEQEAQHLRETVNQAMWDENRGRYSAYLLGRFSAMRAPLADNMAQALAVVWDLADDDRSTTLVEKTPIGHRGILSTYPAASIEPYLEQPSWALTQAYWNLACATVRNEHALRRGLAALYRAQALYQPQHLAIEGHHVNTLSTAASNVAMVLRVFAGIRLKPEGIEFAPTVPEYLAGNKTLLNFPYREATLDITIVGTGNDISLMTLDGQEVEGNYIPADIQGHHNLLIKLQQGKSGSHKVTMASAAQLPATPNVEWQVDLAHIAPWSADLGYKLVINGVRSYSISDSTFKLPPLPPLAEVSVVAANRYGFSLPSRHTMSYSNPPIVVTTPDSTLQADTLALTIHTDHAGTYYACADYTITEGCDIILIEANGHQQGVFYLPATGTLSAQRCALTTLRLLRGDNNIILRRYRIGYRATLRRILFLH